MDFNELLEIVKNKGATAVVSNSNNVVPGSVFVCLKGYKTDGHDYAGQAIQQGARFVVVERDLGMEQQVLVTNSRQALAYLSHAFYNNPSHKLKLIGVTGTNGKTSSVFMLHHILKEMGAGLFSTIITIVGSEELPQDRTTPEVLDIDHSLQRMLACGAEYAVMEVSSHSVVLDRITGLQFAGGIFTNLTQDHLDFHKTMDEYAKAKQGFFAMLSADSVAVSNLDDAHGQYMLQAAKGKRLGFGLNAGDVIAKDIRATATSIEYTLVIGKSEKRVALSVGGEFNVQNSLGVLALCAGMGIDLDYAINRLASFSGVPGRFQKVDVGQDFVVIVDYAHTPDGLENLLSSARKQCQGQLIVVFGCGGDRDRTKRPLMGGEVDKWADVIIVTSDNPRTEDPLVIINDIIPGIKNKPYLVEPDRKKAILKAISQANPQDMVVIAGKGHEDYQEILGVKHHFNDSEVAREGLLQIVKDKR